MTECELCEPNEGKRHELLAQRSIREWTERALTAEAEVAELWAALETVKLYVADQMIWNAVVVPIGEPPHDKFPTLGQTVERALEQRST